MKAMTKNISMILMAVVILSAFSVFGFSASAAEIPQGEAETQDKETAESGKTAQIANPWIQITEEEAKELYPESFGVPDKAQKIRWSLLKAAEDSSENTGALVQLDFELDGNSFTAREQKTLDRDYDLSGMYYTWTAEESSTLQDRTGAATPCRLRRYIGEKETVDLCTWYDEKTGISYSVSVVAADLDGFDLTAVAQALISRQTYLDIGEQKKILKENRWKWAFEEGLYMPEWYYTYTDLDHNGLLEVLAASTQGRGMFTYAHYYEVLADGSGIKNVFHADEDAWMPNDWPEIIQGLLDCYYDSTEDRYYYVCTNTTQDGNTHTITRQAALCLKDGVASWEYIASLEILEDKDGEHKIYTDASGKSITEKQYNTAVERRFKGMEKSREPMFWTAVKNPPL